MQFRLPPPAFPAGTGVGKWSGQSLEAENPSKRRDQANAAGAAYPQAESGVYQRNDRYNIWSWIKLDGFLVCTHTAF
jgi:hypothetical protein